MMMITKMAVKVILVIIIFTSVLFRCVSATNHSVGDSSGWDLSSNLQLWSTTTTFYVGDNLVFRYGPLHDVLEVNQSDFNTCRTVHPFRTYHNGETVVALTEAGNRYFICGRTGYCSMGLRLHVTVLSLHEDNPPHPPPHPPPPPPFHGVNEQPERRRRGGGGQRESPPRSPPAPVGNITTPPPPHDVKVPDMPEPPPSDSECPESSSSSSISKVGIGRVMMMVMMLMMMLTSTMMMGGILICWCLTFI